LGTFVTLNGTTCYGFTCYIGNTCARTTWTLEPLVTGLVEPLGPLMQGLLETPGLTVAGHLVHGQVKEAPRGGWGGHCQLFSWFLGGKTAELVARADW
jgi:hypothetical protein